MKIAFIVRQFPSLSETFILNQITGLIDRGHEVDIYTSSLKDATLVHPDVTRYGLLARTYAPYPMSRNLIQRVLRGLQLLAIHAPKAPTTALGLLNVFQHGKLAASLWMFYMAAPLLGKGPYDIIHCHFGLSGVKGASLRELGVLQGKLITAFHGFDLTSYPQETSDRVYNHLFEVGDLFLPISEHWKKHLIQLGCDPTKIVVHHMGIDCDRFIFKPRALAAGERIRLITVCRLVEKKGVEYGIRAIAKLVKTYPNLEYNVVGDGPLREELAQLIQQLNVESHVKLLGWRQQQDLIQLLDNSHILIAPSVTSRDGNQEGIPVALMEAMAQGLPVVSTLHSGIPELIEDTVSGFLVAERDVEGLAEALDFLIHHPDRWPEMGRAGRTRIENQFNINRLNDRLEKIYQELLTEPALVHC